MNHADVKLAFWHTLTQCMNSYGFNGYPLLEADQYGKQGRMDAALYYSVSAPRSHGWQGRRYKVAGGSAGHTEVAHKVVTVSITAIVNERETEPRNSFAFDELRGNFDSSNFQVSVGVAPMTARELADTARMVVASLPFVELIQKHGVGGVQRATEPRDSVFQNSGDDAEVEVTFTVPLTYTKTLTPSTRVITALQPRIERV